MKFLRTENVEVAQTDNFVISVVKILANVAVENQLGKGVGIERVFAGFNFAETVRAAAVSRRTRRVNKFNFIFSAKIKKRLGIFIIGLNHVINVIVHRVGAGALVENNVNVRRVENPAEQRPYEVVAVHVVEKFQADEIFVLIALAEIVDD